VSKAATQMCSAMPLAKAEKKEMTDKKEDQDDLTIIILVQYIQ